MKTKKVEGDYKIQTLDDIDALKGYTTIEGNLYINTSELTSIDELRGLSVEGDLIICNTSELTSIDELRGLSVEDDVFIHDSAGDYSVNIYSQGILIEIPVNKYDI